MQPPSLQQRSRINLVELKSRILTKLGPERSKQYFDYLNKFLSLKLTKAEFDKLCLRTVGRDGIPLHNQLIRSILRNACTEKVSDGNKKSLNDELYQNGSIPIVPNGDILSPFTRKARTGNRERRGGSCKSALGPNGKMTHSSPSSYVQHSDELNNVFENGNALLLDTRRHAQQAESSVRKERKLDAPLGIPYWPVSIGGPRRAPSSNKFVAVSDTNGLLDTITLKERMEPVAAAHGVQGVSMDSANAVNNGLDMYLKGLIRSCIELNRARSGSGSKFNSMRPGHHFQAQIDESEQPISMLDFRVAMELNPWQLGEDWPLARGVKWVKNAPQRGTYFSEPCTYRDSMADAQGKFASQFYLTVLNISFSDVIILQAP
ncbi:uncharacterized protein [Rutidosis leptorrhynchoides]|uniref:uncharacterized protein n=1 Tax=Rutidosis leptorrhynchoides TaxID=125765 RepID=UPI003A999DF1